MQTVRILAFLFVSFVAWCVFHPVTGCGVTSEGRGARMIASWVMVYSAAHGGKLPEVWADLDPWMKDSRSLWFSPVTRYDLVNLHLPLTMPGESGPTTEVVALHRQGIFEVTLEGKIRGPGRYVVCRSENGEFYSHWMGDPAIKAAFAAAHRALADHGLEPFSPVVRKTVISYFLVWAIYAFIGICLFLPEVGGLLSRLRVAWWARTGNETWWMKPEC